MTSCVLFCSSAVATNTRGPTTLGEACPRPGTGAFQTMFFVSDHSTTGGFPLATALKLGPRHHGQSSGPIAGKSLARVAVAWTRMARRTRSVWRVMRFLWGIPLGWGRVLSPLPLYSGGEG